MMRTERRKNTKIVITTALFAVLFAVASSLGAITKTSAADVSKFKAGNIISDSIFTNYGSMSASKIQSFLNSKVASCDTNGTKPASEFGRPDLTHAQYAASRGWSSPPYTCLKDYTQGGKSAAQIIYDKAQKYKINPQVLIVLLQKEQSLVTDTWPLKVQYQSATGYACPDTAACDSQYYGFTNQVEWGAKMFRAIMNDAPTWYTPYELGNEYIYYSPTLSCGGSTVNIQNRATQALYNYTPYQPNTASLNAGYGDAAGDCDSHGNRNFFLYFSDWFGSTTTKYDATEISYEAFYDEEKTIPISDTITLNPGQKVYFGVTVRNGGSEYWIQSKTKLGTTDPKDRASAFKDTSWLSVNRIATMNEPTVDPGEVATFDFTITAPTTVGSYIEQYNVVEEGKAWMGGQGIKLAIDVVAPSATGETLVLTSNQSLSVNSALYSSDKQSILRLYANKLVLTTNFIDAYTLNVPSNNAMRLVMQSDGNLVIRSTTNSALWSSATSGNTGAKLYIQDDGELVIKSSTNTVLWSSNSSLYPGGAAGPAKQVSSMTSVLPGQSLSTANGKYVLLLQADGNLVLRSNGKVVWATYTQNKNVAKMDLQSDGNLVLRSMTNSAVWYTGTRNSEGITLFMQSDGNIVLRSSDSNSLLWNTRTMGK